MSRVTAEERTVEIGDLCIDGCWRASGIRERLEVDRFDSRTQNGELAPSSGLLQGTGHVSTAGMVAGCKALS